MFATARSVAAAFFVAAAGGAFRLRGLRKRGLRTRRGGARLSRRRSLDLPRAGRLPDAGTRGRKRTRSARSAPTGSACGSPRTARPRNVARTELWPAPGLVKVGAVYDNETRRFVTPLERYRFPLAAGATWSQFVDNFNEATKASGQINRYVRVRGWEKVTTPAGTFDALVMHVVMWLDDEEFWRYPTSAITPSGTRRRCAASCARKSGRNIGRRAATSTAARRSARRTPWWSSSRSRPVPSDPSAPSPRAGWRARVRARAAARSSSSAPPGSACRSAAPARRARAGRRAELGDHVEAERADRRRRRRRSLRACCRIQRGISAPQASEKRASFE